MAGYLVGHVNNMIKYKNKYTLLLIMLLSASGRLLAYSPQVNFDISAESVPRVGLYYNGNVVTDKYIDFSLIVSDISQRFERTSDLFYVVGNISNVNVVFSESDFVLHSMNGSSASVNLIGEFIFKGISSSASQILSVPVIENINQAIAANGFKVNFKSEFLAERYAQDIYANSFTLLLTPIL